MMQDPSQAPAMTADAGQTDPSQDTSDTSGYVIELRVDGQGKISGCVESGADEASEEAGSGGDDDQGMGEYTPFPDIKSALTWALGVYKADGQAPEAGADEKAFGQGYGMKNGAEQ